MSLIAIEFEDERIYVAAARTSGRRAKIQNLFSIEISGSDEEVAQTLKDQLASKSLGRSDTIVVVSRGNSEVRLVDVPPAPENELPDIVRFVARNEFASLNDNWMLDYVRLTGDHAATGQVLAAGVSPEMSNQIKSIVEKAGLRLKHIVLRPFAAVDFVHDRLQSGAVQLLVDFNDQQVDLTIVDGEKVVATRSMRTSPKTDTAEKLVPELRRTIASSSRAIGSRPINQIIVLGSNEEHHSIADRLRSRLECDVQVVDPLKDKAINSRVQCDEPTRYVSLMGAVFQKARGQNPAIDFLNPRRAVTNTGDTTKFWMYGAFAAVAMLALAVLGWWMLRTQAQTIADRTQKFDQLKRENNGDTGKPAIADTLAEVGKIDQWYRQQVNWHEQLLSYSEKALTADDTIVDSLTGVGPNNRADAKLDVKARSADFNTEKDLIESLSGEFAVIPKRSDDLADDKDYPIYSILDIGFELPKDEIKRVNELAKDLMAKQVAARQKAAKLKQLKELPGEKESGADENGGKPETGKP